MEKTVSSNQASLIFCVFTIGLKLSALPALMYNYAGNDCYIVCLIALIFDFLGTLVIVLIMHKHPDMTFHEILKKSLGKVTAIIAQIILLLYFLAKCILVLQELHDYFIATLFEELNPIFFIIVLGLLILYVTTKNFRTVGRLIELIFWPTFIGLLFTLLFPLEDMQIEKLLPLFTQGPYPMYQALQRTTFAFGDYMILLPIMGKVSLNQKSKKKILMYAFGTFNFVLNFFIIFAGSFGRFSVNQTLALGQLPLHNTTPATIGKLEWLTIIIWTVILLTDAIIIAISARACFDTIFNVSDKKWTGYVLTGVIVVIISATYMQLEKIIKIATSPVFSSIAGGIQIVFLIILIIANVILKKKTSPPQQQSKIQQSKKLRKSQC